MASLQVRFTVEDIVINRDTRQGLFLLFLIMAIEPLAYTE